jgi:CHAD domain-containing protein
MNEPTREPDDKGGTVTPLKPASPAEVYPEHDKLGPLATATPPAPWGDADRRAAVMSAFRHAVADAGAAAGRVGSAPGSAVHGTRKALRRARATVELVASALSRGDHDDLVDTIRIARRGLSSARDLDVAPATLDGLALAETDRGAADALVASMRAAAPSAEDLAAAVDDAVSRLTAAADALDAALPPALDDATFAKGLAATYRAARRSLRRARKSRRSLHTWRRRTKELTHQLELVTTGGGDRVAAITGPMTDLSKELGHVVDLILVRDLTRAHAAAQPTGFDADGLIAAIDGAYADAAKAARKHGKPRFELGRRDFARKVGKAVKKDRRRAAGPDDDGVNVDGATD